jgi:hypothetical protein
VARDHLPLSLVRLAGHVDYIHVSDNRGVKPEHLPLGAGAIDWDVFFRTLAQIGYRGRSGSTSAAASRTSPTSTGRTSTRRRSSKGGCRRMIERLRRGEGPRLRAIRLRALTGRARRVREHLEEAERRSPRTGRPRSGAPDVRLARGRRVDLGMVRGAPHDATPRRAT